jgi:glyoxylase-like metal-dependent hydrolase (beta-lactamase superfamily II)
MLAGVVACISKTGRPAADSLILLDSLIQMQYMDEKLLMLSFGAESVSAINTEKGIVLIDAGISTSLTKLYKEKIEQVFQNNPFAYVINTHADHDHYRGNSVFPEAKIVGHINGLDEIDLYWKDPLRVQHSLESIADEYTQALANCQPNSDDWYMNFTQKIRYQGASRDVKRKIQIRKPDITFMDSLTLDMGDISLEMIYFGSCHSNSDILVHVPELKVLFSGDLIFEYGRPACRDQNNKGKDQWLKAIQWTKLRMSLIERVIGGHGQVLTLDDLKAFQSLIIKKTE